LDWRDHQASPELTFLSFGQGKHHASSLDRLSLYNIYFMFLLVYLSIGV
jgi:hypothetical protein